MTGHCAPACHCACAPSTFVPAMYNPALFPFITSSSSSTSSSRSSPASSAPSSPALPLLVPEPKPVVDAAEDVPDCPGWLCCLGLAGFVAAAVILVIVFI